MTDNKKTAEQPQIFKVHEAVRKVQEALSAEGMAKTRKNQQQGYSFRGIDDVYNSLSGLLAEHKLVIYPFVLERSVVERASKNGGLLFYVTVTMEFKLVSSEDGSWQNVRTVGEAMDSGDKATNKAQSAAYKYMAMMTFCIPTEGSGKDSEEDTHEVTSGHPAQQPTKGAAAARLGKEAVQPPVEIKPPFDEATGELLQPHEIQVPLVNGIGDPDLWARIYAAALRGSPDKIEAWVKANAKLMGQLAKYSPKSHAAVTKVLENIRAGNTEIPVEVARG